MIMAEAVAVHRIVAGPWGENCYLVTAGDDAVVIDPGGKADEIADCVLANRLCVHAVLATHGHPDHVGAVAEVVEAYDVPFAVHSGEAGALSRVNFYRFALELAPIAMPPIAIDLATTTALSFGQLEIAVLHTPGHSPGSVCLEIADMLFVGDALATENAPMPGFDPRARSASARRLVRMHSPGTVVYPGHGAPSVLSDAVAGMSELQA